MRAGRYIILLGVLFLLSCNSNKNLFSVSSNSMAPTLFLGDIVKADFADNIYNYGDIIVCYQEIPGEIEDRLSITRIVGLPNDSIKVVNNKCIINGEENQFILRQKDKFDLYGFWLDEYEETFPNRVKISVLHWPDSRPDLEPKEYIKETVMIPAGHCFIMGDNRSDSYDSRVFGPIHKDKIVGKVVKIKKKD